MDVWSRADAAAWIDGLLTLVVAALVAAPIVVLTVLAGCGLLAAFWGVLIHLI